MKFRNQLRKGYTLVELMMVVVIISLLASIATPRFGTLLHRAHQSKTKSNLGTVRTAIHFYYSDTAGQWPLEDYPQGNSFYSSGLSLSGLLAPYLSKIPTPTLHDRLDTFNGLSGNYDIMAEDSMAMNPPKDVYIVWGPAGYTPMLNYPYAYDNQTGTIYIANGNYDVNNHFFFSW